MAKSNKPILTDGDYCVRLVDFDTPVRGVTAMDDSGFANVYINARQSHDRQCKAFFHEMRHILRDDFCKENENG